MTIPQLTVPGAGRPQPPNRVPEPLQWPLPLLLEKLERFRSEVHRYADDGDALIGGRVDGLDGRLVSLEAMFPPDATLSLAGRPADAAATGNNIRELRLAQSGFVSHSEGTDMTLALMGYYDRAGQHFYHSRGHQPNPDGALYVLHPWLMEQYTDGGGVARTRRKQWDRMRGCLYVDMETNRTYAWRGPDDCADADLAAQGAGYVGLTEDYFDGAAYDSATKKIQLKHGDVVKAEIDATAFVKDGMVSSVAVSGGNLVITFNTDAGAEPISIPITDIFNPANYYNKTDADDKFVAKEAGKGLVSVDASLSSGSANPVRNSAVTGALAGKIDKSGLFALYDRRSLFPQQGEEGVVYVNTNTGDLFRWASASSQYISLVPNSSYFDGAVYDSATKKIKLKHGNTVKAEIATTDFFDPANYYDRITADGKFVAQVSGAGTTINLEVEDDVYTLLRAVAEHLGYTVLPAPASSGNEEDEGEGE